MLTDLEPLVDQCLVIGCGGTGSQLIPNLARLLSYHPRATDSQLTIADGDTIETKNLERQAFGPEGVGANKAEMMLSQLSSAYGLSAAAHDDYVDEKFLRAFLSRSRRPLIVCSVDNDYSRKISCEMLLQHPEGLWVSPGNSDGREKVTGQVLWCGKLEGEAIGVDPTTIFDNIKNPEDVLPAKGGCMEHAPSLPQLICANALAASWALAVVQNYLDESLYQDSYGLWFNAKTKFTANFS